MSELKRKKKKRKKGLGGVITFAKPPFCCYCAAVQRESKENNHEKSAEGASALSPFTPDLSILSLLHPPATPFSFFPPLFMLYCICPLCSCKSTIISTVFLLCGAHGKDNCYRPIFSMELCK